MKNTSPMRPSGYTIDHLKKIIREPSSIWHELRYLNRAMNRKLVGRFYDEGIDVMSEDWDNLIILDACRYDALKGQQTLEGDLNRITSKGTNSWEFVRENFGGRELFDTIYVTSNVHFEKLEEPTFFKVERLFGEENRRSPDRLVRKTIEVNEKYPNKRLIVHFIIPHTPYLNPMAESLRQEISDEHDIQFRPDVPDDDPAPTDWDLYNLKNACEVGYITDEDLREAYHTDAEIGLEHAADLVEAIDGKSVITADHGEMLGDRIPPLYLKDYGHTEDIYHPNIRDVPWLVCEDTDRRNVVAEQPIATEEAEDSTVEEQLEALGYK